MNKDLLLKAKHVYHWILFVWSFCLAMFVVVPLVCIAGFIWGLATFTNPINSAVFMLQCVGKDIEYGCF